MVVFKMEMRWPSGWAGSYKRAVKLGSSPSPKPATPCCAPLAMRNVPSGRAAFSNLILARTLLAGIIIQLTIQVITRLDGCRENTRAVNIIFSRGLITPYHALEGPARVLHVGLNRDAVIQCLTKVRSTADKDGGRVGVGCVHGEHDGSAFHRVGTTSQGARNGSWHVREHLYRLKGLLVKKTRLVVVTYPVLIDQLAT